MSGSLARGSVTTPYGYLLREWNIRRSPKYLAKLAHTGGGQKFRKVGRNALYEEPALDDYARTIMSPLISSTSELAAISNIGEP